MKGEHMPVSEHDAHRPPGAGPAVPAPVVKVTGETVAESSAVAWPRGARLMVAAAVVVLALGAGAVAVTLANPGRLGLAFSDGRPDAESTVPLAAEPGVGKASADGPVLTEPLAGRDRASFELVDGLTTFDLRIDDLGEDLYRITSPADGGVIPRTEFFGDHLRLRMATSGRRGPNVAEVVLSSRVTWRLRLAGGVAEQVLDLTRGRLAALELAAGAARVDLRLPRIVGTLRVRVTGGVDQLVIRVPGALPTRVRAGAGAGAVTIYDRHRPGVATGALISSPGWDRSTDRVYVDMVAGANTVTVNGA
ncbi:hypothetical protein E1258_01545 [Micromonospora sp. KC207]|nr:hypothetical protein E1258_01545 [Micromonospora sp. KC207]